MPNWSDPAEIVRDAGIFQKFCLALLGVSTWEVFAQLPFDYSMVTGQRKARWPLIIYLYCKYSLWFAVIGVNVALNVTSKVDCQSLYVFNQFAGNTAIGSASTLLMLRTIAIWSHKHAITIPLVVLSLGQWAILFHVKSSWSEVSHACVVTGTKPAFIDLIYLYTMSFDFVVMVASVVGLLYTGGRSSLWILLFKQGVVYFVVAFTANLIPAVFLLLDLNPIMNIMFTIPAATATSIVACRSFVSLTDYKSTEVYVQCVLCHLS
ncbi:uncharacterized protein EI90DRAFT_2917914 [Cantharellus anzutake]|uniref:uncharacterized protein n=1 Tax=Cantharellus anzutake TaxID=1750568 RepID=UPI001905CBAF|nr:uncharacterized protein EI90DRAFT_2917914 [Cantharellus anzutake]KAF8332752.1 hypothetical protein EI90DRAFT_2917914 [Cantharellus anzutake]